MKSSSVSECPHKCVSTVEDKTRCFYCKRELLPQSGKPKFGTDFWYGKVRGSDHVRDTTKMMDEAYLSVTNDLPNRGEE